MTEQSDDAARAEAERLDRVAAQRRREAERAQTELEPMTDWELIGERLMPPHVTNPMELNRRLKNSVVDLTGELGTFRQSLEGAVSNLTAEIHTFRQSSDKLTRWLIGLTVGLLLLTLILVILTAVLINRS